MFKKIQNEKGRIFYGLHMYPGVAEYQRADGSFRIFLNENTIRKMDPTFAGRPVFVKHVDEVAESVDELRTDADGWVIESFFNAADGRHWAKFIVVSEKGLEAIRRGWSLSNCYFPQTFGNSGLWNGVSYEKEVTNAEYEHLAIVPNPRYEESVIMTPEEFKKYNEDKNLELKRLANSEKDKKMTFRFFKREKVENSDSLSEMVVVLPKSKREALVSQLLVEADEHEVSKTKPRLANAQDKVKVGDKEITVSELLTELTKTKSELEKLENAKKECNEDDEDDDSYENEEEMIEEEVENEDDEEEEEIEVKVKEKEKKENKKKNEKESAKKKAESFKNAPKSSFERRPAVVETSMSMVKRGQSRYGSN